MYERLMKLQKHISALTGILVLMGLMTGCGANDKSTTTTTKVAKVPSITNEATKPYAIKLAAVKARTRKISQEANGKTKVADLKQFEAGFKKYQRSKHPYQQIISEYQSAIKQLKQTIQTSNLTTIKQNSETSTDSQSQLAKKNANLKALKTALTSQLNVVYSVAELNAVDQKIEHQLTVNNSKVTDAILSTNDQQKYIDAYNQFTEKGNPKGQERGTGKEDPAFFEAVGLTEHDYYVIWGGIFDYYGNAVEQGWVTKSQAGKATIKAHKKLVAGGYAKLSTALHHMNSYQISVGNYSSLIGTWSEVAEGLNHYDARSSKFKWQHNKLNTRLTIAKDQISDGHFILNGNENESKITENGTTGQVTFDMDKVLTADAEVGAIRWTLMFYPRGTTIKNVPRGLDFSKEHLVVTTSSDRFIEIFERE